MERKINCNVLTPEGKVYAGEVDFAVVPAFKGEMGFLYNHAPLIAQLGLGEVRLMKGQDAEFMVVEGGFVEIIDNKLCIFPLKVYKKSDLFKEDIQKEIKELQEQAKTFDYTKRFQIMEEIGRLKIKLKVASR